VAKLSASKQPASVIGFILSLSSAEAKWSINKNSVRKDSQDRIVEEIGEPNVAAGLPTNWGSPFDKRAGLKKWRHFLKKYDGKNGMCLQNADD
jgi:hypothetical protein